MYACFHMYARLRIQKKEGVREKEREREREKNVFRGVCLLLELLCDDGAREDSSYNFCFEARIEVSQLILPYISEERISSKQMTSSKIRLKSQRKVKRWMMVEALKMRRAANVNGLYVSNTKKET